MEEISIKVAGMHCKNCQNFVSNTLQSLDGVVEASVDLIAEKAKVVFDRGKITEQEIIQAVNETHFDVVEEV